MDRLIQKLNQSFSVHVPTKTCCQVKRFLPAVPRKVEISLLFVNTVVSWSLTKRFNITMWAPRDMNTVRWSALLMQLLLCVTRVVVVQSFSLYWEPYVVNIVIRSSNEPAKVTTVSQIPASAGLTTSEGLTVQSTVEVSTTSSSAPQPSTTSSSTSQPTTTSSSTPQPSITSSASQPDTAAPSSSAQPNRILTPSSSPRHAAGDGENRMQTPFPASPTVPSGSRSSSLNSSSPTSASLDLQVRRGNRQDLNNNGRSGRLTGWLNSLFGWT